MSEQTTLPHLWIYTNGNGEQIGPIEERELIYRIRVGQLNSYSLVRSSSRGHKTEYHLWQIPELHKKLPSLVQAKPIKKEAKRRGVLRRVAPWIVVGLTLVGCFVFARFYSWSALFWLLVILATLLCAAVLLSCVVVVRVLGDDSGKPSAWKHILSLAFEGINWRTPWHVLPGFIGVINLVVIREKMRKENLNPVGADDSEPLPRDPRLLTQRSPNGMFNDLKKPRMGSQGTPFGRMMDINHEDNHRTPNPRTVSERLLKRKKFQPARSLNLLAAAWIQFQVHGWVDHLRDRRSKIKIELTDNHWRHAREGHMEVYPTMLAPNSNPNDRISLNNESHWWDGSQIYGSTECRQKMLRSGPNGKLTVEHDGLLPLDQKIECEDGSKLGGIDLTGMNQNYWVGLSMLHTLFVWEHNAICDRLKCDYPEWKDHQLFQTARLINAALIAKIHTVEWTPGILNHPAIKLSLRGNWWGVVGESYKKNFGRISESEVFSGIPGSQTHHHGAPYQLPEEFVSVYRLHPLIPDEYSFWRVKDNSVIVPRTTFTMIQGQHTRSVVEDIKMPNLFYSFGLMNPGAVTLNNFPNALREFTTAKDGTIDLATVDIYRDRERGVPRYNEFRRALGMRPLRSFRQLVKNKNRTKKENDQLERDLKEVYENDIEKVDLMIGMYAEEPPKGFGFSDTAFRVFILMASRRLKSDRFFTVDFRREVYTQIGLDWINDNDMSSVLIRHLPELAPAIKGLDNIFGPWNKILDGRVGSDESNPT